MGRGPWCMVTALLTVAHCEIFQFQEAEVLSTKSLHIWHAFYIHANATGTSEDHPFLQFQDLSARSTSDLENSALAEYQGLQVGLLPYKHLSQWINPQRFCGSQEDALKRLAKQDQLLLNIQDVDYANRYIRMVPVSTNHSTSVKDSPVRLHETGVYLLFVSNCGNLEKVTINGLVVVKNPYGFLPGNQFPKMAFYAGLALVYLLLAFVWLCLLVRRWNELTCFHHVIGTATFIGLVETTLWCAFFKDWNQTGLVRKPLFTAALLFTVMKSVFAYTAALVVAQGWGVTKPSLDNSIKVQFLSVIYTSLEIVRQTVLSVSVTDFHTLSATFLLYCLLLVAIGQAAISFWIFSGLSNLMRTLQELKEDEKLLLFERMWCLLVGTFSVTGMSTLYEMVNTLRNSNASQNIDVMWNYQWIFSDGVSHTIFVLVLVVLMCLWVPRRESKHHGYVPAVGKVNGVQATNVWADDEDLEDENMGSAAVSGSRVAAEIIGVAGNHEEEQSLTMSIE